MKKIITNLGHFNKCSRSGLSIAGISQADCGPLLSGIPNLNPLCTNEYEDFKLKEAEACQIKEFEIGAPTENRKTRAQDLLLDSMPKQNVSNVIVDALAGMKINHAFGVSGGGVSPIWGALSDREKKDPNNFKVIHCRHENGAAFSAIESNYVTGKPAIVFSTTGPGLTNTLTGMLAARTEGAKIVLLSGCTSGDIRGKGVFQETHPEILPAAFSSPPFHSTTVLESEHAIPSVLRKIANGLASPGGYVCNLCIPLPLQRKPISSIDIPLDITAPKLHPSKSSTETCIELLEYLSPVGIWVGHGARKAHRQVRELAERLGARVLSTPRGKGIFPEDHPLSLGVTGMWAQEDLVISRIENLRWKPRLSFVLGTSLTEGSSSWNQRLLPEPTRGHVIHVDIDPGVVGMSYPLVPALPVQADVCEFLDMLLERLRLGCPRLPEPFNPNYLDGLAPDPSLQSDSSSSHLRPESNRENCVRPEILMNSIQRVAIDAHDCMIMAEGGAAFAWATRKLRFCKPGRFRVSTQTGSMGHFSCGVVGAALALSEEGKGVIPVAIVGDGSMLMNNEVNTAVSLGVPCVWIVLNDASYGMCAHALPALGIQAETNIPKVDFAMFGKSLGAIAETVTSEKDLDGAIRRAITAKAPVVLDVHIDPSCPPPASSRYKSLMR